MKSPVDKVYKINYILKGKIHLYVSLSSIVNEETGTFFFNCVLEKTRATKKKYKQKKVKKANLLC